MKVQSLSSYFKSCCKDIFQIAKAYAQQMVQDLQDGELGIFACVRLFESDWDSTASKVLAYRACGLECARLSELGQTPVALPGGLDNPSIECLLDIYSRTLVTFMDALGIFLRRPGALALSPWVQWNTWCGEVTHPKSYPQSVTTVYKSSLEQQQLEEHHLWGENM